MVPAQPLLHKFVWPFAGPFCGRTDPDLSRSVDPKLIDKLRIQGNTSLSSHPFSPFDFQGKVFHPGNFEEDRRLLEMGWVEQNGFVCFKMGEMICYNNKIDILYQNNATNHVKIITLRLVDL